MIDVIKGAEQIIIERQLEHSKLACVVNKCSNKYNNTRNQLAKKYQLDIHDKTSFLQLLALPSKGEKLIELAAIVCNCCKCTLAKQHEFLSQKTGLEEVYTINSTNCIISAKCNQNFILN